MQERVVEREMLADEIRQLLANSNEALSDGAVDALVEEFHSQTTFEVNDQNRIVALVDMSAVKEGYAMLDGQSTLEDVRHNLIGE